MKRVSLIAALAIIVVLALVAQATATVHAHDGPVTVAVLDGTVYDAPSLAVVADFAALPSDNYMNALLLDESRHAAADYNYMSGTSRNQRPTGFKESEHRARDVQHERG